MFSSRTRRKEKRIYYNFLRRTVTGCAVFFTIFTLAIVIPLEPAFAQSASDTSSGTTGSSSSGSSSVSTPTPTTPSGSSSDVDTPSPSGSTANSGSTQTTGTSDQSASADTASTWHFVGIYECEWHERVCGVDQ